MTIPRERPILFNGPMVRAILDGAKTETRRPVEGARLKIDEGDLLYVRETWTHLPETEETNELVAYRADGRQYFRTLGGLEPIGFRADEGNPLDGSRWRPSIHHPKRLARIWLRVLGVSVERVQDIDEADIIAEGATVDRVSEATGVPWSDMPDLYSAWRTLWQSCYGEESWARNRRVQRIRFSVVSTSGAMIRTDGRLSHPAAAEGRP